MGEDEAFAKHRFAPRMNALRAAQGRNGRAGVSDAIGVSPWMAGTKIETQGSKHCFARLRTPGHG
jgi:hypothetical protein